VVLATCHMDVVKLLQVSPLQNGARTCCVPLTRHSSFQADWILLTEDRTLRYRSPQQPKPTANRSGASFPLFSAARASPATAAAASSAALTSAAVSESEEDLDGCETDEDECEKFGAEPTAEPQQNAGASASSASAAAPRSAHTSSAQSSVSSSLLINVSHSVLGSSLSVSASSTSSASIACGAPSAVTTASQSSTLSVNASSNPANATFSLAYSQSSSASFSAAPLPPTGPAARHCLRLFEPYNPTATKSVVVFDVPQFTVTMKQCNRQVQTNTITNSLMKPV
jgi:hypothetical protein